MNRTHIKTIVALSLSLVGGPVVGGETAIAVDPADPDLAWGPCPEFMPAGCEIAVLHGDPALPNADVFLRTPGRGYRLPAHTHGSAERMILIAGEMTVRYAGANAETLRPGAYAYGPAGMPHEAACESAGPCILFIAFEQAVDANPFDGSLD